MGQIWIEEKKRGEKRRGEERRATHTDKDKDKKKKKKKANRKPIVRATHSDHSNDVADQ